MMALGRFARLGGSLGLGLLVVVLGLAQPGTASAELHPTTTRVDCTSTDVNGKVSVLGCEAFVVDQSATATTPTGSVTFTPTGSFSGSPCTLSRIAPGGAACKVDATADLKPGDRVTAAYGGDATHVGSSQNRAVLTPPAAPQITNVIQAAASWRVGTMLPQIATAGPPVGTTFALTLDRPARVQFLFTRTVIGRRVGGKCVAQTSLNRRRARCLRSASAALGFNAHAGRTRLRFQGRINRKRKLTPGFYRLRITATANGRRSKPAILRFTILH